MFLFLAAAKEDYLRYIGLWFAADGDETGNGGGGGGGDGACAGPLA